MSKKPVAVSGTLSPKTRINLLVHHALTEGAKAATQAAANQFNAINAEYQRELNTTLTALGFEGEGWSVNLETGDVTKTEEEAKS